MARVTAPREMAFRSIQLTPCCLPGLDGLLRYEGRHKEKRLPAREQHLCCLKESCSAEVLVKETIRSCRRTITHFPEKSLHVFWYGAAMAC